MYPSSIFPPPAYPGSAYPGAGKFGSAPSPSGAVGLYPGSMFPAGLFPASLFPVTSGAAPSTPTALRIPLSTFLILFGTPAPAVVLPGSFLAAVRGALKGDAVLGGMVGGNFWHRIAPPGTPQPLVVYSFRTDARVNSSYKSFLENGSIKFTAYAPKDATARAVADRIVDVLTDATPAWSLYGGRLIYCSLNTPLSSDLPVTGYGGARTYAAVRVMDFVYQGTEA